MKLLIISYKRFPSDNASTVRELTFGKMFKLIGYNVSIVGMGGGNYGETLMYKGFECICLRSAFKSSLFSKIQNYAGYSRRLKKFLRSHTEKQRIDAFFIDAIPPNALVMVKNFAKKNNINLLHDCVEWYSPEQFKLKWFNPNYIVNNIQNKFLINKDFKVVAISKFLEEHFIKRNIQTIRIPVIMDINEINYNATCEDSSLKLVYAGSPGRKDFLKEILEGIGLLDDLELEKIEFIIIGATLTEIKKETKICPEVINRILPQLKVLGRQSRDVVLYNLLKADFTVLLRSSTQRYAKAGFPTKVVESLAAATPIILNLTSDLDDYLQDQKECIVVENCTAQAFNKSLKQALSMSTAEKIQLKINSRECAIKQFNYLKYLNELKKLI